jgi:hypothetical protein
MLLLFHDVRTLTVSQKNDWTYLVCFFGPSEFLIPALFNSENKVPLKPMLAGVRHVAFLS